MVVKGCKVTKNQGQVAQAFKHFVPIAIGTATNDRLEFNQMQIKVKINLINS